MILQYAIIPIDPDSREEAIEALTELGEQSRAEEGVVDYRVTTDVDDENTVRIIEQYEDEAGVEAHMTSEHFEAFQGNVGEFAGGPVELYKYEVSDSTQLM
ncbi:putative quinol monooxygenase [Halomarina oriensis]|uniref:Antibiotic biosynthesis monooxygenase n=1 Tax=Halomarina oriensis TaxID=671145 RepID=A0A6B0GLC0_9EURY|nr:putative quinol monooxygenase [Halomarina oriensis]MWG32905.1 antibiotic biosynthesis monooxygenase [Halomarina oriensis]